MNGLLFFGVAGVLVVGAFVVLGVAGLLALRALRRRSIRNRNHLPAPPGIERLESVVINGTKQWLHIRGEDQANPVLLFLHGGPGGAGIAFGRSMQKDWERHFTVVQWDQRGGGKTYTDNPPDKVRASMTTEQFLADAEAVIEHLCRVLGKEKLILLGHSWGTYLGVGLAARRPDLVSAYVGSGQIVHPVEFEAMAYDLVLKIARERGDEAALKTLSNIPRPPSTAADFIAHNRAINLIYVKYMDEIYGEVPEKPDMLGAYWSALCSPEYSLKDVLSIHRGAFFCRDTMFGPASVPGVSSVRHVDVRNFGTAFKVPMLLFLGRHDYACPSAPATEWLETIEAPWKALVWFERSGHSPMTEQPREYLDALLRELQQVKH